jgi:hypothetical protein
MARVTTGTALVDIPNFYGIVIINTKHSGPSLPKKKRYHPFCVIHEVIKKYYTIIYFLV